MQQDVEQFLRVLEAERGFSVNTIFAYRNDLTQFHAFLRGESADEGGRETTEAADEVITLAEVGQCCRSPASGTS